MVYLHRYSTRADGNTSVEIAAVEDDRHAERYEARGFTRCSAEDFRAAWRLRDQQPQPELERRPSIREQRRVLRTLPWLRHRSQAQASPAICEHVEWQLGDYKLLLCGIRHAIECSARSSIIPPLRSDH
jgi:hypothetical protein